MKTSYFVGFTAILAVDFFVYNIKGTTAININMNLNCQDPSNIEYCIEEGYNRDKLPPNPPLNVTMTLAISVRRCFRLQICNLGEKNYNSCHFIVLKVLYRVPDITEKS